MKVQSGFIKASFANSSTFQRIFKDTATVIKDYKAKLINNKNLHIRILLWKRNARLRLLIII